MWGLDTKASACTICPFHRNYFYQYLKNNEPTDFKKVVDFDKLLEQMQPFSKIRTRVFLSRSRKRVWELTEEDCNDAQTFEYRGQAIWNGF